MSAAASVPAAAATAAPTVDPNPDEVTFTDSDDEESTATDSTPALSAAENISKAQAAKEAGNAAFTKDKNLELARQQYAAGIKALKAYHALDDASLPAEVTEEHKVEIRSLLVSLHGNKAMIYLKEEKWTATITSAGQVLQHDANNVKARYRRGTAHAKVGNLEHAKADLTHCLVVEPGNAAAKKELVAVTKQLKETAKKEKEAYANMFAKKSMYGDKEKERAEKARREELALLAEKDEYTQSKLNRRSRMLEEQTFDEWKKEKQEKRVQAEKDAKEAEEAKKKQNAATEAASSSRSSNSSAAAAASSFTAPKQASTGSRASKSTKPHSEDNEEEEEDLYDEEDAKIIAQTTSKGYCYFRNEQAPEVKSLIGDITPKTVAASNAPVAIAPASADGGGIGVSSWNKAGTWEERDTSASVKQRIAELVWATPAVHRQPFDASNAEASVQEMMSSLGDMGMGGGGSGTNSGSALDKLGAMMMSVSAKVSGVKCDEGDAQIVMARGKKRHLYEVSCTVDFEVVLESEKEGAAGVLPMMPPMPPDAGSGSAAASSKKHKYKGSLQFTDLGPDCIDAPECVLTFKKAPSAAHASKAKAAAEELKQGVIAQLLVFHTEYLAM